MKIGVYAKVNTKRHRAEPIPGLCSAIEARFGIGCVMRNPNVFNDTCAKPWDLVIVWGLRGNAITVWETYRRRGIPVIVADWGYYARGCTINPGPVPRYQFSIGCLNWLPPIAMPDDRAREIGLIAPEKQAPKGETILFAGQSPGDPQHNMNVLQYAQQTIRQIRFWTDRRILYRAHPWYSHYRVGEFNEAPADRRIEESIANAYCMVTHSSTSAFEAMRQGVPVFCEPSAMYADGAITELTHENIVDPPQVDAQAVLNRVAYGQWTHEEFAEALPFRFACNWLPEQFREFAWMPDGTGERVGKRKMRRRQRNAIVA